jgi:hypothetical protein
VSEGAAATVAKALEALREAGRRLAARPAPAVHDALADVLEAWRAPGSPWQAALVRALPAAAGFTAETVREGLARALAPFGGDALRELVRDELGGPARLDAVRGTRVTGFPTTATVLAGALPLPTLVSVLAPLVLRSPVLVKPSAHDPVTAPLLARALAERDPALGAAVAVVDFRHDDDAALDALCNADCVVATGSDAAVGALAARAAAARRRGPERARRFVGYGHRLSLALLGPAATGGELLARASAGLALDVALWDQLGCLSPVSVLVADGDPWAADRVADALGEAMAGAEARWPRGRVEPDAAAAIARERAEAEMRAAGAAAQGPATRLLAPPSGAAWTVVREADAAWRPAPLHRFLRVLPVRDGAAALEALRPAAAHLAAVALAGFGPASAELGAALARLGASLVCAPGTLQAPPLGWPRDGLGVLAPLARHARLDPVEG